MPTEVFIDLLKRAKGKATPDVVQRLQDQNEVIGWVGKWGRVGGEWGGWMGGWSFLLIACSLMHALFITGILFLSCCCCTSCRVVLVENRLEPTQSCRHFQAETKDKGMSPSAFRGHPPPFPERFLSLVCFLHPSPAFDFRHGSCIRCLPRAGTEINL